MTRLLAIILLFVAVLTVVILGYRGQRSSEPPLLAWDDMVDQAKYKAQAEGPFFADGRAMRQPPGGVLAWGRDAAMSDDGLLPAGASAAAAKEIPVPLDSKLLLRGQQLFNLNCAVCHGGTGSGDGVTSAYGMIVPTYHSDERRALAAGAIWKTITEGKGQMGPYGDRIRAGDRWAVVGYVRALQRARNARIEDVPQERRSELKP